MDDGDMSGDGDDDDCDGDGDADGAGEDDDDGQISTPPGLPIIFGLCDAILSSICKPKPSLYLLLFLAHGEGEKSRRLVNDDTLFSVFDSDNFSRGIFKLSPLIGSSCLRIAAHFYYKTD